MINGSILPARLTLLANSLSFANLFREITFLMASLTGHAPPDRSAVCGSAREKEKFKVKKEGGRGQGRKKNDFLTTWFALRSAASKQFERDVMIWREIYGRK